MRNILWANPSGQLAITAIVGDDDPLEMAARIIENGDLQSDWNVVALDVNWESTGFAHDSHRWDGASIVVDFEAAKEETRARLRRERIPLLELQDIAFRRALEEGQPTTAIVAETNRLRDITDQVSTVAPGDLAALLAMSCSA